MLDTPGGTLAAEFSPMGPVLNHNNPFASGFGEHPTPPQLSLSRSNSEEDQDGDDDDDDDVSGMGRSGPQLAASPFSGFINDFHQNFPMSSTTKASTTGGGLQGVTRSPLRSERRA